ncbi:MAG: homocysteine S-methyltransferase family protein [Lachnospiraceae bacterium]|nr:homocysteine S-methyltransferase family protein [Lachnospiraceae bacterium]
MSSRFRERLNSGRFILFDGGLGTMLQARGLKNGEIPEKWNLERHDDLLAVHKEYVAAGADVITTNTFGANSRKYGGPVKDVIEASVKLAKEAGSEFVALDIGPTGAMLRPLGDFEFDDAYELFKEQVIAGNDAGADLILIETMTDLKEAKAAVLAAKENSELPVVVSLSYEKNGRTFLGASAACAAVTFSGLGVDALGVNCSVEPDDLEDVVDELCRYSSVPVIVQANAGLPSVVDGKTVFSVGPEEYVKAVAKLLKKGRNGQNGGACVQLLGGCCGTTPDYIRKLNELTSINDDPIRKIDEFTGIGEDHIGKSDGFTGNSGNNTGIDHDRANDVAAGVGIDAKERNKRRSASEFAEADNEDVMSDKALVCSSSVIIDYDNKTAVVGERINPTGKKRISAALREGNYDLITTEAQRECDYGAEVLDVNAGLADIDEKAVLKELVYQLEGACTIPLQIDTTDPDALEAAVRVYSGKPIINSVNGKEENLKQVLPIAAKYGAALICLTLDEGGIPQKAEDRIKIAEKIIERAAQYGIPKKNIIVDGLVMTVSTNQKEARETLRTVRMAREKLGVHTCLGVSNISFGLPEREVMNSVFLAEAFSCGLNLPIIDPTKSRYMQAVYSHRVLDCEDTAAEKYIAYALEHPAAEAVNTGNKGINIGQSVNGSGSDGNANKGNGSGNSAAGNTAENTGSGNTAVTGAGNSADKGISIADIVISGKKGLIEAKTTERLMSVDAMELINNEFIPALDRVGELYEQGKIFLPQLMNSAETAKKGFEVIKASSSSDAGPKHMSIVLATVKGDIHDIGKNIVRMLLENYGFDVIDLGKDVDPKVIVDTVKEKNIHLVGLSALMTTTVKSMEETIKLLKESGAACKIMVGGAVMSEVLAKKIGADYYAKDAAASAKIAAEVEKEF